MGTGIHGGFGKTSGYLKQSASSNSAFEKKNREKQELLSKLNDAEITIKDKPPKKKYEENAAKERKEKPDKKKKEPIFSSNGHLSKENLVPRAEFFLGKSVARIEHELQKHGYETLRRPSKHSTSKAKIIVTTNPSKERNVSQVQVSPGSKRHGNVPYVKISTTDQGRFKIIGANPSEYKSDGQENAMLIFGRKGK